MPIQTPSEEIGDRHSWDTKNPQMTYRLTAQNMLWNRDGFTGYEDSIKSTRYGESAPRRAINTSFTGFHDLNRANPSLSYTMQNQFQKDSQLSFLEE